MNIAQIAKMAQQMQSQVAQAQDELKETTLEATAGGGAIRVVITATDLRTGKEKFFVNCPPAELRRDPGVDLPFLEDRVENPADLLKAIIAGVMPEGRRNLAFEEVNLAKDPTGRRALAAFTGHVTFPQIVIDGSPIGGFAELEEVDEQGLLEELAAA